MPKSSPFKIAPLQSPVRFLALLLGLGLWIYLARRINYDSDSKMVILGSEQALECLKQGQFKNCNAIYYFPLFQYIPGLITSVFKLGEAWGMWLLGVISLVCYPFMLFKTFQVLKKKSLSLAGVAVCVLIASPLPHYARSTFGEMLAATLLLIFVCETFQSASSTLKLGTKFIAAGITKEIVFPFLWAFEFMRFRKHSVRFKPLIGATVVVLFLNGLWNYFRYGSFSNTYLLEPYFQVSNLKIQAQFFLALLISPSGGLLFFWPAVFLLLLGQGWILMGDLKAKSKGLTQSVVTIIGLGIFLGLVLGLSRWFSPFGGRAWGPRLLLPWLPALMVALFYWQSDRWEKLLNGFKKNRLRLIPVLGFFWFGAFTQIRALFSNSVMAKIFEFTPQCPIEYYPDTHPTEYYQCYLERLWPGRWDLLELFKVQTTAQALHFGLAALAASLLIYYLVYSISVGPTGFKEYS